MLKKYILTTLVFFLGITIGLKAQYDETILKAMSDELNRNKENLVFKDYDKPFFISYSMYDLKMNRYSSTLGGKFYALKDKRKQGNVRVMAGDYQLTDENFSDRTNQYRHNDGSMALPYNTNYDGIRRYFWMATNNVYKNAAESYKNKVAALKQQNMVIDDLPAYDFSKETPQEYIITEIPKSDINLDLGHLSEELSKEFKKYPDIIQSFVNIVETELYRYYINTEGTRLAIPEKLIHIEISGTAYNKSNEPIRKTLYFDATNKGDILPLGTLKSHLHALADNILESCQIEIWDDSYTGPVLFEDQAIYQLLLDPAFTRVTGFIGTRENLIKDKNKGIYLENRSTLESRIDKKIAASTISIYDIPKLKTYKNKTLMGHYSIDNEGVIPKDTLTLVESGILKSLLMNRTPLKSIPHSNGHSRTSINNGQILNVTSPGNIFVKSSETSSKSELMKKLSLLAEEEGLDYAIIIRPAVKGSFIGPLNFYKVDLKTGNETLITGVNTRKIAMSAAKDIVGASDKEQILNSYHNYILGNNVQAITAASFIYPDALLVEDVDLTGYNQPVKQNPPVIPNPLIINK